MAILDFPSSPNPNQEYIGPNTGVVYRYNGTTGAWVLANDAPGGGAFRPGAVTVFVQPAAPTGWTQIAAPDYNDAAIRLVNVGGGTGGTIPFSSLFTTSTAYTGTVTLSSGAVGATTLNNDQIAAHVHVIDPVQRSGGSGAEMGGSTSNGSPGQTSQTWGGGQTHTHSITSQPVSATFSSNFNIRYSNVIVCSKS
jgi:hypothetical protein